jgi:hypothetical protein
MTTKPLLSWSLALALFAVAAPGVARAAPGDDEKPVKDSEVPKAVRDSVEKKYPKCTVKKWESETNEGKTVYEAGIEVAGKDKDGKATTRKIDVGVSAEGKIFAEEERIAQAALPEAVQKAWADSKYAKAKVLRVERIGEAQLLVCSGQVSQAPGGVDGLAAIHVATISRMARRVVTAGLALTTIIRSLYLFIRARAIEVLGFSRRAWRRLSISLLRYHVTSSRPR